MKKKFYKEDDPKVKISKKLTFLLRHGAEKEGLPIRPDGYVPVDAIIEKLSKNSIHLTYAILKEVVDTNDKKRFELAELPDPDNKPNSTALYIRATQGHSIKSVENEFLLTKIEDASSFPVVVHGSFIKSWDAIKKGGLRTMSRNHVHFAPGYPGEKDVISGMRAHCSLFIEIDMEKAMKDGMVFFLSANNVILTSGFSNVIPQKYFKVVRDKNFKIIFDSNSLEEVKKEDEEEIKDNMNTDEEFEYLLVLDFEAQCDQDGDKKKHLEIQEIIEFPVVPINVKTKKIETELIFHHYIKPVKIPKLTEFCTFLTGIKQEQVDNGIILEEALELLHQHLVKHDILNKKWSFLTCGDWDLSQCLRSEAKKKGIILKPYMKKWINIKKAFLSLLDKDAHKNTSMTRMLEYFKLELDGRHHSGIDDSKNISKIAIKIMENGFKFTKKLIHEYK